MSRIRPIGAGAAAPGRPAATRVLSAAIAAAALAGPSAAAIIHVDDDAGPGGDGSSWASPLAFLRDAVGLAGPGDEIRVAGGTYRPDQDAAHPAGTLDPEARLDLAPGVTIVGGLAGLADPADPDRQDVDAFPTVVTGDLLGDDGPGFVNRADNSRVLFVVDGDAGPLVLDGCTLRGADSTSAFIGTCLWVRDAPVMIRRCRFLDARGTFAAAMRIKDSPAVILEDTLVAGHECSASEAGSIFLIGVGDARLERCVLRDCVVHDGAGAALRIRDGGTLEILDCVIRDNVSGVGAVHGTLLGTARMERTEIVNNLGGGGFLSSAGMTMLDSIFRQNTGGSTIGGWAHCSCIVGGGTSTYVNCRFLENTGTSGGLVEGADVAELVNCIVADNVGTLAAGGIELAGAVAAVRNCTIAGNGAEGLRVSNASMTLEVVNSIVVGHAAPFVGDLAGTLVDRCVVEGGWPGDNLDVDPMFVQPGTYDFRLSSGSPCIDAGSLAHLPADALDLDGDGDLGELIPFDVDGEDRVQGGSVDLGAHEGAFAMAPPAAEEIDLDPGEIAVLSPASPVFDPVVASAVFIENVAGPEDATALVVDLAAADPSAPRPEDAPLLELSTSLADGEHRSTVMVSFSAEDLAGEDPLKTRLIGYDPDTGDWSLAVALNGQSSPGHDGPVGDRFVTIGPSSWVFTYEIGDHGVHWDPGLGQGFAWAHVDRAGTFGLRYGACVADVAPAGGDGVIGVTDLLVVLAAWGTDDATADLDGSGVVDAMDLVLLMDAWGACP